MQNILISSSVICFPWPKRSLNTHMHYIYICIGSDEFHQLFNYESSSNSSKKIKWGIVLFYKNSIPKFRYQNEAKDVTGRENYRPIFLISAVAKILNKIQKNQIRQCSKRIRLLITDSVSLLIFSFSLWFRLGMVSWIFFIICCPICWHVIITVLYDPLYFCGVICHVSSFMTDFMYLSTHFLWV